MVTEPFSNNLLACSVHDCRAGGHTAPGLTENIAPHDDDHLDRPKARNGKQICGLIGHMLNKVLSPGHRRYVDVSRQAYDGADLDTMYQPAQVCIKVK